MKHHTTLLALAALAGLASADLKDGLKCQSDDRGTCLSSFFWCLDNLSDCKYPKDTDPLGHRAREVAVYHGRQYDITWTRASTDAEPMLIEWLFPSFDKSGDDNIKWSKNVTFSGTDGLFVFDPEEALAEFPTPHSNMTRAEAIAAAASGPGHMWLSQAGDYDRGFGYSKMWTGRFVVLDSHAAGVSRMLHEQAASRRTRELGISLGVGLGVGLPLTAAITWFLARRKYVPRSIKNSPVDE